MHAHYKDRYKLNVGPSSVNKYGFYWTEFTDLSKHQRHDIDSRVRYQYKRKMSAEQAGIHTIGLAYKTFSLKFL